MMVISTFYYRIKSGIIDYFVLGTVLMDSDVLVNDGKSLVQIAEGKTKVILEIATIPDLVVIRSKDSITAFNAKRHNEVVGKAQIANDTTCSIFESLQQCGMSTFLMFETELVCVFRTSYTFCSKD
jgi:hypothetical protein